MAVETKSIVLLGAPSDAGNRRAGCLLAPGFLRLAGIADALSGLGHRIEDRGDLSIAPVAPRPHPNRAIDKLAEAAAWTEAIAEATFAASADGRVPLVLGGDHSVAAGTVAGFARRAAAEGRPAFLLWLDAHPDDHTLETTRTGNLHGVPVAYVTGRPGFEGHFPPLRAAVPARNVALFGIRSVDPEERAALAEAPIAVHDMRAIDEFGVGQLLRGFLDEVEAADGVLHVSLDVDFLDPALAPAVATTVPGGATFREAHLVMETIFDSGRVRSMDVVELNPFLDERGRTATLLVDLVASLFGRRLTERPTRPG